MLKSSFYIVAFSIFMILVNLLLLFLVASLKSDSKSETEKNDAVLNNIYYRVTETSRIDSKMINYSVPGFNDALTGMGTILDSTQSGIFKSSFILVLSGNMCSTCIPESIEICSRFIGLVDSNNFYVISDYSTPNGFFILLENNGLDRRSGIYSRSLARYFGTNEEVPILLKLNANLIVVKACFVEKHLPKSFYENFFKIF